MKKISKHRLGYSLFISLITLSLTAGSAFSLPYAVLGDPLPNAPELQVNGAPVGTIDYVSDAPGGDQSPTRDQVGTRITYQYVEPVYPNQNLQSLPLLLVFHGNGGNSGSFCPSWMDHSGDSIIERADDVGNEFILVCVDGHPPVGKPLTSKFGHWHYHYSEYNFDAPHDVDHRLGVENVISKLTTQTQFTIDTNRIYLVGFSGGGLMTHLLAMEGLGAYDIAASAIISAALGGIKNQETNDPGNPGWNSATGGYNLGNAVTTFSDCAADVVCEPIPSSQLIYPTANTSPVPTLIQLGNRDPHFPVSGGEDEQRFETAVACPTLNNEERTGVSSLFQTATGYRLKNSTSDLISECPHQAPMVTVQDAPQAAGYTITTYNDTSAGSNCKAVTKVVVMNRWGHQLTKGNSAYDSLSETLAFFDEFGVDPVNGTGGGLGN